MFQSDLRNGHGKLYEEGVTGHFEGNFIDGKKSGFGDQSGKYVGEYLNNKQHGLGQEVVEEKGDCFTYYGNFSEGYRHGQGSIVSRFSNYFFKGEFKEGKRSGEGEEVADDGSTYKGEFRDDLKSGKGEICYSTIKDCRKLSRKEDLIQTFEIYFSKQETVIQWKRELYGQINERLDQGKSLKMLILNSKVMSSKDERGRSKQYNPKNQIYLEKVCLEIGYYLINLGEKMTMSDIQLIFASFDYKLEGKINYLSFEEDFKQTISENYKFNFDLLHQQIAHIQIKQDKLKDKKGLIRYKGCFSEGLSSGKGILITQDYYFNGKFENGRKAEGALKQKYDKSAIYNGEFNGVYMHGLGAIYDPSGEVFRGKFYFNQRSSKAKLFKYKNGSIYEGEIFPDGKKDGKGKFTDAVSGLTFDGTYRNDMMENGKLEKGNRILYEGPFLNNRRHTLDGSGTEYFESQGANYTYKGKFFNDVKLGTGILTLDEKKTEVEFNFSPKKQKQYYLDLQTSQRIYIDKNPDFELVFTENAQIIDSNGNQYRGGLLNNMKFGSGELIFLNGDVYRGKFWINDMHGKGRLVFASGTSYSGEFVKNRITGDGIMTYPNGDSYEGCFLDGKRSGQGTYRTQGSEEYSGTFESDTLTEGTFSDDDDQLPTEGTFDFQTLFFTCNISKIHIKIQKLQVEDWDQRIISKSKQTPEGLYQGQMMGDLRHGVGRMNYTNGDYFEGTFRNDKRINGILKFIGPSYSQSSNSKSRFKEVIVNNHSHPLRLEYKQEIEEGSALNEEFEEQKRICIECNQIIVSFAYYCQQCSYYLCPNCMKKLRVKDELEIAKIENDVIEGVVKIKFANQDLYEGHYFQSKLQGRGSIKYANLDEYTGQFFNNQMHGQGKMEYAASKDKYEGDFMWNERFGWGLYSFKSGAAFEGYFFKNAFIKGTFRESSVKLAQAEEPSVLEQIARQCGNSGSEPKRHIIKVQLEESGIREIGNLKTFPETFRDYILGDDRKIIHQGVQEKYLTDEDEETNKTEYKRITALENLQIIANVDFTPNDYPEGLKELIALILGWETSIFHISEPEIELITQYGMFQLFTILNTRFCVKTTKQFSSETQLAHLGEIQRKIAINQDMSLPTVEYIIICRKDISKLWFVFEVCEFVASPQFSLIPKDLPQKLKSELSDQDNIIEVEMARALLTIHQLFSSCLSLHSRNIAYHNFYSDSIILMKNYSIKLLDFSLAQHLNSESDEYHPLNIVKEMTNRTYLKAQRAGSQLSTRDIFENDYYQVLKLSKQFLASIPQEYSKSIYYQELKNIIVTTNSDYFQSSARNLESYLSKNKALGELLLNQAKLENNMDALNFISFVISRDYRYNKLNYHEFFQPIQKVFQLLRYIKIESIDEVFLAVTQTSFNNSELKDEQFIKNILLNQMRYICEQSLRFLFEEDLVLIDWNYFEAQISHTQEEVVSQCSSREKAEETTIRMIKQLIQQAVERFKSLFIRLSSAQISDSIQFPLTTFQSLKKCKNNSSLIKVGFITDRVEKQISDLFQNQYGFKIQLVNLCEIISFRKWQSFGEVCLENSKSLQILKIAEARQTSFQNLGSASFLMEFTKPLLIQKILDDNRVNSLKQQSTDDFLTFITSLLIICSSQLFLSDLMQSFSQEKHEEAEFLASNILSKYSLCIQTDEDSQHELSQEQKELSVCERNVRLFSFLEALSKKIVIKKNSIVESLLSIQIKFEIESLMRKNCQNDYLESILNIDFSEQSENSKKQVTQIGGVNLHKNQSIGMVLDQERKRNDFGICLSHYLRFNETDFKKLRVAKIKYIETNYQVKALKIYYKITETGKKVEKINTPWYGLPEEQENISKEQRNLKNTIVFKKDNQIRNILMERKKNIALLIVTTSGEKYAIGDCRTLLENADEEEIKKVLWFECAFRPTHLDYPDEREQIMYHFAYYWTDLLKK